MIAVAELAHVDPATPASTTMGTMRMRRTSDRKRRPDRLIAGSAARRWDSASAVGARRRPGRPLCRNPDLHAARRARRPERVVVDARADGASRGASTAAAAITTAGASPQAATTWMARPRSPPWS
jgi:hypothetical protein